MENVFQIFLNDHSSIKIDAMVKETNDTFLQVHKLLDGSSPLLLEIKHQQLNTMLELTKVYPYVLLYFDEEDEKTLFKGAAFNQNESDKQFAINTQYKKILFIHFPISFKLNEVSHLKQLS